jgi:hypothetical protein
MSYGSKTAGLAEHWDVIQDEATRQEPKSGRPMFVTHSRTIVNGEPLRRATFSCFVGHRTLVSSVGT